MPLNFPCSLSANDKKKDILDKLLNHCEQTKVMPGFNSQLYPNKEYLLLALSVFENAPMLLVPWEKRLKQLQANSEPSSNQNNQANANQRGVLNNRGGMTAQNRGGMPHRPPSPPMNGRGRGDTGTRGRGRGGGVSTDIMQQNMGAMSNNTNQADKKRKRVEIYDKMISLLTELKKIEFDKD